MGVYKEIAKADGSGITTFYRLSEEKSTVETTSTGTTETMFDYNNTLNKPSINDVALVGNKTLDELGIQPAGDYITEIPAEYITEEELESKDYATEAFVIEQINNAEHFHREIVDALPLTGKDNILYLVPKKGSDKDIYNEYIWTGVDYEFMGTTAVDLTDYYQKREVDELLDNKVNKVDGKQLSTNDYTTAEKTKLASLENYDDTELRNKVNSLHNYDDTAIKQEISQLKTTDEDIYKILGDAEESIVKKLEGIRLVKSGDSWIFYDMKGSVIPFQSAKASLGFLNTILFLEDIENDGKMTPVHYDIDEDTIHVYYTNYDGEYRYAKIQSSSVDDSILGITNHYIGVVDTLTIPANKGDIAKLSTDKTIYLYDGTEWSAFDKASSVDLSNYLAKDNTIAYKPATDYNPSTKKYVDDSIADIFVPTKTSQLTNDSGFVLKSVNDLTNYYNKSNTYNKAEVNALVAGGGGGESLIETLDITNNLDVTSLLNEGSHIFLLKGEGKLSFKVRKNNSQSTINLYEDTLVFTYYDESGLSITYLGLQEYGNVIFEGIPNKSSVFKEISEKEINYIDGSSKAPGTIMRNYINITTSDLDIDVYLNGSEEITSFTLPHSTLLIGQASKIINRVSKGLIIFPTGEIYTITKATVSKLYLTRIYDITAVIDEYGTKQNIKVGDDLTGKTISYAFPDNIERNIVEGEEIIISTSTERGDHHIILVSSNILKYRYIDTEGSPHTQDLCTITNGATGDLTDIPNFTIEEVNTSHYLYPYLFFKNQPILNRLDELERKTENIYSTEEQVIGTWIDDKPIYKKTYHGTTTFDLDESSQLLIPASVNVDKIINCSGYLTENSGNNVLTVNEVRIVKVADNRVLFQSTNNNLKNCPYAITFEYTKTTN